MQVKHAFTSGLADGPDATLVRPSNWNADHTLVGWDALTADKTVTVGSSGCDYTTLQAALDAYASVWVPRPYKLTFSLAAEIFTIASTVQINSPTFRRASITGASPISLTINSVQSSSGSAGAWSYVLNVGSVAGLAVDQLVCVKATSGGSNPDRLLGVHRITNVDGVNTRITISVLTKHSSQASGAVTATATVLTTVLKCNTNVTGLYIIGGGLGTIGVAKALDNIGISTTAASTGSGIDVHDCTCELDGGLLGIHGPFAFGMIAEMRGTIYVQGSSTVNTYVSGGTQGIGAYGLSAIQGVSYDSTGGVVVSGCTNGLYADSMCNVVVGGSSAGYGPILEGNTTNAYAYSMSIIRRYNNKKDNYVTTANTPTAGSYNTQQGAYIEYS